MFRSAHLFWNFFFALGSFEADELIFHIDWNSSYTNICGSSYCLKLSRWVFLIPFYLQCMFSLLLFPGALCSILLTFSCASVRFFFIYFITELFESVSFGFIFCKFYSFILWKIFRCFAMCGFASIWKSFIAFSSSFASFLCLLFCAIHCYGTFCLTLCMFRSKFPIPLFLRLSRNFTSLCSLQIRFSIFSFPRQICYFCWSHLHFSYHFLPRVDDNAKLQCQKVATVHWPGWLFVFSIVLISSHLLTSWVGRRLLLSFIDFITVST